MGYFIKKTLDGLIEKKFVIQFVIQSLIQSLNQSNLIQHP
jgi:hypothetical protein